MAEYNIDNPILFIKGQVTAITSEGRYAYDDATGLGPSGSNISISYNITVSSIDPQSIGSSETRTGTGREYNGLDIKTGDWVTNNTGKTCLQVTAITAKSESSISFTAKDVDAFVYKNYRTNAYAANVDEVAFFEVSDSGKPLIAGEDAATFFGDKVAADLLQSRFAIQEEDERFRVEFSSPQNSVEEGQVVTIDANGDLVPFGTAGSSDFKLGLLVSLSYGNTIAYLKPFNTIIDDFAKPEKLTGSKGDFYYASTVTPGDITTNSAQGSDKLYFQFKDAVPTVITATTVNSATAGGDTLLVNGVASVSGARTIGQIVSDINAGTATHFVTATQPLGETVLKSYDNGLQPANGDIVMVTSVDGGGSTVFPEITISDGNNTASVSFQTSDSTFPGTGGAYLTVSATQMAADINTACNAASVDITASTEANTNGANNSTYPKLVLTLGSGSGITITEVAADAAGQTFQQATAMPLTANTTTDRTLILTRADGGDILLTGSGTFVNSNGIVSSSAGTPALLVMVEDEEGAASFDDSDLQASIDSLEISAATETGVTTKVDRNKNPLATTSDEDSTGITITYTPFSDSAVTVKVNGLQCNIGDGAKDEAVYFSADGGTTAKTIANIAAGDTLYWMGSLAGYELETDDDIDIDYQASSNDV
jgi:hypothetical protein